MDSAGRNFDLFSPYQGILVNYVWMNPDIGSTHPIPSYLFCRVQENACKYPHTQFQVWGETPRICDPYDIPPNVVYNQLQCIPEFSKFPIMLSNDPEHIWMKVDIARLLVLDRCLRHQKCEVAVYSDFDVEDILIYSHAFSSRICEYGAAFGGIFDPKTRYMLNDFDNGYAAFSQKGHPILCHVLGKLTPYFQDASKVEGPYQRDVVFLLLQEYLCAWALTQENDVLETGWARLIGGLPVQFPSSYRGDRQLVARPAPVDVRPLPVLLQACAP